MPESNETYLSLVEEGIDIPHCRLNLHEISIRCADLSRYRKALRVKIRTLLKIEDYDSLEGYINMLFALGNFAKSCYGYHSCNSPVSSWQEELAGILQKAFDPTSIQAYTRDIWIEYDPQSSDRYIQQQASLLMASHSADETCVQDSKPFLTQKDRSHFNKVLQALGK